MKQYTLLLLLSVIIITACGGSESRDGPGLVGQNTNPTPTVVSSVNTTVDSESPLAALPDAKDQVLRLPDTDALPGRLLYLQGNTDNASLRIGPGGRLFLAKFDGSESVQLAERISESSVMVSHDRSMVGYAAVDGYRWYLYIMNLDDQQPVQIYHLRDRFGFIEGWSPDMKWVLVRSNNTGIITSVDGATQYTFPSSYVFWLEDSRALVVEVENFFDDSQQDLRDLFIFNPVTDERTALNPTITAVSLSTFPGSTIQTILREHGTSLVANSTGSPGVFGFPFLLLDSSIQLLLDAPDQVNATLNPCDTWTINEIPLSDTGEATTVYTLEDTLNLSDFAPVGDDSLLFTRWYMDNCDTQVESLRSEVIMVNAEGEAEVIVDDIYPGVSTSFMRASTGRRYAISPDGRYLAAITGSFTDMNSAITLIDLSTGDNVDVMTWQSADANSFLIWEAFTAIFWVQ